MIVHFVLVLNTNATEIEIHKAIKNCIKSLDSKKLHTFSGTEPPSPISQSLPPFPILHDHDKFSNITSRTFLIIADCTFPTKPLALPPSSNLLFPRNRFVRSFPRLEKLRSIQFDDIQPRKLHHYPDDTRPLNRCQNHPKNYTSYPNMSHDQLQSLRKLSQDLQHPFAQSPSTSEDR